MKKILRKSTPGQNKGKARPGRPSFRTSASRVPRRSIHLADRGHSHNPSIHSGGMLSRPTPAPMMPPKMAAVVSVSPPQRMTSVMARRKSLWQTSQKFAGEMIIIPVTDHKLNLVVRTQIFKIVRIETGLFTTAGAFNIHYAVTSAVYRAYIEAAVGFQYDLTTELQ